MTRITGHGGRPEATRPEAARPKATRRADEGRGRGTRLSVRGAMGVLAGALLVGAGGSLAGAGTPTVQVESNPTFGAVLTTGAGAALYTLDTDHNGHSTCHGSCATAWPPLDVAAGAAPTAGPGVTGTLSAAKQADGTTQVTYNGSPLYTFVGDSAPGQVTGNEVSGFLVVTAGLSTTTTTMAPAPGTPPGPAQSPPGPGSSPTSASASGPAGATTPAPAASPGGGSAATGGTLAFTGSGPVLAWLVAAGLLLIAAGAILLRGVGSARRPRAE